MTRLELVLDKGKKTPVYRQVIEQITQLVQKGELAAGEKLPPERELAKELGTSRGTITKAYERLAANKIVSITQGSGTFVSSNQNVMMEDRKDRAVSLIKELIVDLEREKFTHQEIGTLFHLLLMEREELCAGFTIAAVDCNPEALAVFEEQLRHLSNIRIVKFLLADVLSDPRWERRLGVYDLVLVTSTHHADLLRHYPALEEKTVQAAVSPSQQTIIDLASIPSAPKALIVCRSPQFLEIIRRKLTEFQLSTAHVAYAFESADLDLDAQLKNRQVLIVPPDSPLESSREHMEAIGRFLERGGKVVHFTYQIECGTLIHIEEKISNLLELK
jgi:DNA-binding transcriptional regulator YhcF (GntR family)